MAMSLTILRQKDSGLNMILEKPSHDLLLNGHSRTWHDALTLLARVCDENGTQISTAEEQSLSPEEHANMRQARPAPFPLIDNAVSQDTKAALRAWSTLRFVRGGLFTAEEAMDMVDHFYTYQAPFSPAAPEYYAHHSRHHLLIEEEPILTITILMIGSRYRKWTGPAAASRSCVVHDRLWRYLQGMISRLFWFEDNFVGEFTSLSDPSSSMQKRGQESVRSIRFRTLGTCEALLLVLDWHPRALHFPPIDDDTTSIVITETPSTRNPSKSSGEYETGAGHLWLARSGHLCRSMLSTVSMLATELGFFDGKEGPSTYYSEYRDDLYRAPSTRQRAQSLQYLIWIYATQQQTGPPSWRISTPTPSALRIESHLDNATECWVRVATLVKRADEALFRSQRYTQKIIRNGQYISIMQSFQPLLQEFIIKFNHAKLSRQMRLILSIEFNYIQLCIFSLSLQAMMLRRCQTVATEADNGSFQASSSDEENLSRTARAARSIVSVVVDDLLPDGDVKHIPVRSYSRILGAALVLLQLCASEMKHVLDIAATFSQIKQLAGALETCVVDDTHLSTRWGVLLAKLTDSFQSRLSQQQARVSNSERGELNGNQTGTSEVPEVPEVSIRPPSMSRRTQHQNHPDPAFNLRTNANGFGATLQAPNFDVYSMWWDITRPVDAMTSDQNMRYIPMTSVETDMSLQDVTLGNGHDTSFTLMIEAMERSTRTDVKLFDQPMVLRTADCRGLHRGSLRLLLLQDATMAQMRRLHICARKHLTNWAFTRPYSSVMAGEMLRVKHKAMINVDLGEGYGNWACGPNPETLLPLVDHANIACGFHASDPLIMLETVRKCKEYGVKVGAHPGFPDLQGFGRREMKLSSEELTAITIYQIGSLKGFLDREGVPLNHVKPHGMLYGVCCRDYEAARAVFRGIPKGVPVFGLAGTCMEQAARDMGIEFIAELFADVKYNEDGTLVIDRQKQYVVSLYKLGTVVAPSVNEIIYTD
ncbi:hypothetical protein AYL99_10529 [Fonsecaea erecta]|uniref:Lactam utilization protein lamB n=1 Tax=Fonsecaea erecta TaxID=1367422 RepID=A0A178Z801_9EURO|nr:hypothetical protein AYL99_10529 [Fonsecaea erecta]OAP55556.1 hypothetical protein AYL99_10529 [Fonsecaea erecta]